MSHELMVTIFLLVGAIVSVIPGRVVGQVLFEKDEDGCPAVAAAIAAAIAFFMGGLCASLGYGQFRAAGLIGMFVALPSFWVFRRVWKFCNNCPELNEEQNSWKSAALVRSENLSLYKAISTFAAIVSGGYVSAVIAHHFGWVAGMLAVIFVAPVCAIPATGALFGFLASLFGLMGLLIRLYRIGDGLSQRISCRVSASLRCRKR